MRTNPASERKLRLALAVGVGLVVSLGLLVGLRAPERTDARGSSNEGAPAPSAAPASNGAWERLRALALGAPASADVKEKRKEALAERAKRRAYDGAPPRVPHQVHQREAPDCLFCHADGLQLAGRTAPKMSHEPYSSCLQCHVVERSPINDWAIPDAPDAPAPQALDSWFEGNFLAHAVAPWGATAPPPLPHSTHMRSDCSSCHGPSGRDGLRTSHPDRQSCEQCHAHNELDGARRFDLPPPGATR